MSNQKVSSGLINQSGNFNFTGNFKVGGVGVAAVNIVIPVTGGGILTAGRTNELGDGNIGYLLPLANSVDAGLVITITMNILGANPEVSASGSDTITNINIIDTVISFAGPTTIQLASNGLDNWRFV